MRGGEFDHLSPDLQPVASMSAPKSHKLEIMSKYMCSVMTRESVASTALFLINMNVNIFFSPSNINICPNICQSQQDPAPISRYMRMHGNVTHQHERFVFIY